MSILKKANKILFISTFPPSKCGIASFTQDLVNALNEDLNNNFNISICALDLKTNAWKYERPVSMVMEAGNMVSCMETALKINQDPSIDLVCIEHEFGLYGGEMGDFILEFLDLLEKPVMISYHTVLPNPDKKRLKLVQAINTRAAQVIVMTKYSARVLADQYLADPLKINIIPHGSHPHSLVPPEELKKKFYLEGKKVLTTFGLLSPNKGIEKAIMAMKEICQQFPQAIYMVIGQTHPNLILQEGEKYRNFLQQLIDTNELGNNVRLVNEYIPTHILMEYLSLTDIYLFTSKDPFQAVSGTFLYAMSAGCPIISNSFVLAKEMLDRETGIILETSEITELANAAIRLLSNDELRIRMGQNAFLRTRETTWNKVAKRHLALFSDLLIREGFTSGQGLKITSKF